MLRAISYGAQNELNNVTHMDQHLVPRWLPCQAPAAVGPGVGWVSWHVCSSSVSVCQVHDRDTVAYCRDEHTHTHTHTRTHTYTHTQTHTHTHTHTHTNTNTSLFHSSGLAQTKRKTRPQSQTPHPWETRTQSINQPLHQSTSHLSDSSSLADRHTLNTNSSITLLYAGPQDPK